MMNNLFSSFDFYTLSNSFYFYLILNLFMILYILNYHKNTNTNWVRGSTQFEGFNSIMNLIYNSIKPLKLGSSSNPICISIFMMIGILNILGLFPYINSITGLTFIILLISVNFWLISIIIFIKNKCWFHLIPMGSPILLVPFLFIIELISNIIRPLTLALRLSANITSGHILIHLVSKLSNYNMALGFMPSLSLNIMETIVSVIQTYVFMSLIFLYISEVKYDNKPLLFN
uniref:ATP synthase subunit a n=1 Tax=Chordodes sp. VVA-2019 TaxID=2586751 RepID=A0A514ABW2_9BILA|nr:ATP synthase F0 subunit 6 [Chordodes sp. VVA-2019]